MGRVIRSLFQKPNVRPRMGATIWKSMARYAYSQPRLIRIPPRVSPSWILLTKSVSLQDLTGMPPEDIDGATDVLHLPDFKPFSHQTPPHVQYKTTTRIRTKPSILHQASTKGESMRPWPTVRFVSSTKQLTLEIRRRHHLEREA